METLLGIFTLLVLGDIILSGVDIKSCLAGLVIRKGNLIKTVIGGVVGMRLLKTDSMNKKAFSSCLVVRHVCVKWVE